jgi:hypothetical protein
VQQQLAILVAGDYAAQLLAKEPAGTGAEEYAESVRILESLGAEAAEIERAMTSASRAAVQLVRTYRTEIRAVAEELLVSGELQYLARHSRYPRNGTSPSIRTLSA